MKFHSNGLFWKAAFMEKHEGLKPRFFELAAHIDWTLFEKPLQAGLSRLDRDTSKGGRPPFDALMMFRIVVLQHFYQVSDDDMEFQLHDRLSFRQFAGLAPSDRTPDSKTIWLFKNELAKTQALEVLFDAFGKHVESLGYRASKGQLIDASIQEVRKPRSMKPEAYETPAALAQKDEDATFTKKGGKTYFGYKNHVSVDEKFGFVRKYVATTASPHDSQLFHEVFDEANTGSNLYADSAYRGGEIDAFVEKKALTDRRQHRAYRNKPLTGQKARSNKARSKVRARVEHVFSGNKNWKQRFQIRSIGLVRARFAMGLNNLVYNMRRLLLMSTLSSS